MDYYPDWTKMADLSAKNHMLIFGICTKVDRFWPINWPNINVFE